MVMIMMVMMVVVLGFTTEAINMIVELEKVVPLVVSTGSPEYKGCLEKLGAIGLHTYKLNTLYRVLSLSPRDISDLLASSSQLTNEFIQQSSFYQSLLHVYKSYPHYPPIHHRSPPPIPSSNITTTTPIIIDDDDEAARSSSDHPLLYNDNSSRMTDNVAPISVVDNINNDGGGDNNGSNNDNNDSGNSINGGDDDKHEGDGKKGGRDIITEIRDWQSAMTELQTEIETLIQNYAANISSSSSSSEGGVVGQEGGGGKESVILIMHRDPGRYQYFISRLPFTPFYIIGRSMYETLSIPHVRSFPFISLLLISNDDININNNNDDDEL